MSTFNDMEGPVGERPRACRHVECAGAVRCLYASVARSDAVPDTPNAPRDSMDCAHAFHAHSGWQFKRDPERMDHSLEVVMYKDGSEVARFDAATWTSIFDAVSAIGPTADQWHFLLRLVTGWPPRQPSDGIDGLLQARFIELQNLIAEMPPCAGEVMPEMWELIAVAELQKRRGSK